MTTNPTDTIALPQSVIQAISYYGALEAVRDRFVEPWARNPNDTEAKINLERATAKRDAAFEKLEQAILSIANQLAADNARLREALVNLLFWAKCFPQNNSNYGNAITKAEQALGSGEGR